MYEGKANTDEKLAKVKFDIDKEAHITIDKARCPECVDKPCIPACPAANYSWNEENKELVYNYEGCMECGTCRFICDREAITWSFPRGGFGVAYRWG